MSTIQPAALPSSAPKDSTVTDLLLGGLIIWDREKERKAERQRQRKQDQDNARHKAQAVGGLSAVAQNTAQTATPQPPPRSPILTKNMLIAGGLAVAALAVIKQLA